MKTKVVNETPHTLVIVFDAGDEVVEGLMRAANDFKLSASQFTAIGAFSEVTLGYFNLEKKDYQKIPVQEQVEVLSLIGDIALRDAEPVVHAHVVVGKSDGSAYGGHLLSARVRPTLEVVLTESPKHLHRKLDPELGLALIDLKLPP